MTQTFKASLVAAAALCTSSVALAHTGHGHQEFSTFDGLVHALSQPDHLAMLALGIVVTGALAPWVLRGIAALGRRLHGARKAADTIDTAGSPGAQA
jgi:hydrogenase/urease accessory protein HupE